MENILSSKLFTTRRGTIIMGIVAAVLAAIVLLVYLNHYRNSVNGGSQPLSVLVAKSLIQKGTPGDVVGSLRPLPGREHPAQPGQDRRLRRPEDAHREGRDRRHLPGPAAHRDATSPSRARPR